MPGPLAEPEKGKTRNNRSKKRNTMRSENGIHERGSQNRNKKYRVIKVGQQ